MILEHALERADPESPVRDALEGRTKEIASLLLYVAGIFVVALSPWLSIAAYVAVSCMWLIPDRRFEGRA
jgi:hypothetical protein